MLKLFSFFLLFIFLSVYSDTFEGSYKVKMFPYTGSSKVYSHSDGETLFIDFKTSVAFNTVKLNNHIKMLLSPLMPLSIYSDYNKLGIKSEGYFLFSDSFIETYSLNAKIKIKQYKTINQPNDWLILPFFLRYYDKDKYACSMPHGDFNLEKITTDSSIEWESTDKSIKVKFIDSLFTYLKAGKIEMIMIR
ncbi:MAG: hypothetical protein COX48_04150 [bacterium (Candidatus Stahlbacteria) CG23_combo_of_CG06-09_8_20_14_all_34_7]|nr:MAG: hypothetical protein COX48_04150 [bacterium (Candidatus Stahlbacteria) CG23_combo_of_CG06-09_8_20_14_all_34_7]